MAEAARYPRVVVNRAAIAQNVGAVAALCQSHGVSLTGVTKVCCGAPAVARVMAENGVAMLGDSRVANLRRMAALPAEKWLIRPPMPSEIAKTVRWADVSLCAQPESIALLGAEAQRQGKRHRLVLMADLGDLREGYADYDALVRDAERAAKTSGIEVYGIGTNLTCFSFVQPDEEKMTMLAALANRVAQAVGGPLQVVSGGNSATLNLLQGGGMPPGVNNLRLGEGLLFGRERAAYTYLPGTRNDAFVLECEVVECACKPSLPWGTIGQDSYGNRPSFTDKGLRRRVICALGKQDFDPETTWCTEPGMEMLGASSDHLMLDVTDCATDYRPGDIVRLRLGYYSTLRAFTSGYVARVYR